MSSSVDGASQGLVGWRELDIQAEDEAEAVHEPVTEGEPEVNTGANAACARIGEQTELVIRALPEIAIDRRVIAAQKACAGAKRVGAIGRLDAVGEPHIPVDLIESTIVGIDQECCSAEERGA